MLQEGAVGRRTARGFGSALSAAGLLFAATAVAGPHPDPDRVSARDLAAPAIRVAFEKLERRGCRELLEDFRDAAGRRLAENLESTGMTPGEFLATLAFRDGRAVPRCASGRVAAGANFGSRIVAICKGTFARAQAEDRGHAANLLIHEMLHALGLGEDPPTSEEITRQVARRCGS